MKGCYPNSNSVCLFNLTAIHRRRWLIILIRNVPGHGPHHPRGLEWKPLPGGASMSHFLCRGLFCLSPKLSQGPPVRPAGLWNNTYNGPSRSLRKSPGPWECHLRLLIPLIKTFQLPTAEVGRMSLAVWPIIWGWLIHLPALEKIKKIIFFDTWNLRP